MIKKPCFVLSPIGDDGSETRKNADYVFNYVITPALEPLEYKPFRSDQMNEPGIITAQIIQNIVEAPLVVANLTGRNANVYYELAIRHALRKPFIQLIPRGEQPPFDVAQQRMVTFDLKDLESVDRAKKEIREHAQTMQDKSEIDTPFSVAVDLQTLRQSGKKEERSLGDILSGISQINAALARLEQKMDQSKETGRIFSVGPGAGKSGLLTFGTASSMAEERELVAALETAIELLEKEKAPENYMKIVELRSALMKARNRNLFL